MTVLDNPVRTTTRPPTTKIAESTTMSFSGLESLQKGIIHTDISPAAARWMVFLFLGGLAMVPLVQLLSELRPGHHVQELDLIRPPARAARDLARGQARVALREMRDWLHKENLAKFEEDLKEASIVRHAIQPRMQL